MTRAAYYGMFFLSGAGALAFETVWFGQAGLVVGNSVWSAALTVGAFMAGLALGNALAIPLAPRLRNPVLGYAGVEAVAAVSGAALVVAFPHLPSLFAPLLSPLLGETVSLDAARAAIAFLLMAVPATALGATLPLLAKPLAAATGSYGFALGRLYGVNTLGAVAGTLLAELVLIPELGLRGSGFAAAACNLGAAAIAWRIAGGFAAPAARAESAPAAGRARVLSAAFLAGGALLALEVVWFRFLLLFVDGTTLVFAVMLACVLAGIGLGGLAAARLARRGQLAGLARAAAAGAGVFVVAGYWGFRLLVDSLSPLQPGSAWTAALLCVFLMAPAAVLSGFLFTALGERLRAGVADAGAATGMLTLANTLGAMTGSLLAAFALLPLLGMETSFSLLALVYLACVLAIPGEGSAELRFVPALAAVAALALFPFGKMTSDYYRGVERRFGGTIVAAREGLSQTTFYLRHDFLGEPLFYRLATNSYSMASTAVGVERYMKLFAWLPAALHPRIERVLLVGFGVGATASAVAALPEVKQVDVVDTSRDILEMSEVVLAEGSRHPLRDARFRTHIEDARFFLQMTDERYDLITGEPPPPKIAGVVPLYTREYFSLMKSRLNEGGIATYWLPAYLLLEKESLAVIRAFCEAFEDCSLWSGLKRDWILVGSRGGAASVSREHFSRLWRLPVGESLRRLGIHDPAQLAGQFMADAASLREIASGVEPLVDDHPRRIRSALYAEPSTPVYTLLMSAERGRERLLKSPWASLLPAEIVAASVEGFRLRGVLEAAFYPELRRPGYSFWRDVADLIRNTELVELPRWLLGSGARAASIAARKAPADPLAAQHAAIDALANRRAPAATEESRFAAMTPEGQTVIAFHQCLSGEPVREVLGRLRERDAAFAAWAAQECAGAAR
jgi:spermidine synthase